MVISFNKYLVMHKKIKNKKVKTISIESDLKIKKDNFAELNKTVFKDVNDVLDFPERLKELTWKEKTIAIISDGSSFFNFKNIVDAILPALENKSAFFKQFANLNAVPIILKTQNVSEIIETIKIISPSFSGINLEYLSSPKCFEIEERLDLELNIPVVHGFARETAIVVLAGLINAHKVVNKNIKQSRVAILGAGVSGIAIAKLLKHYGVGDVVLVDSVGIICASRSGLNVEKEMLSKKTNSEDREGGILEAVVGADVMIGVSVSKNVRPEYIRMMAQKPIVFTLADPMPEILPSEALSAGAEVVATGNFDYVNSLNNALVYPGLFKGLIKNKVRQLSKDTEARVAVEIAGLVKSPTSKKIFPTVFNRSLVKVVSNSIF